MSRIYRRRLSLATVPPAALPGVLLFGTLAFLGVRPLLGLLHAGLVVVLAAAVRLLSAAPIWPEVVRRAPLDPVYTLALIQFVGEVHVRGVAVGGPVGDALHAWWPGWFAAPELAAGNWVSAVLEPGATALGRGLVGFGADFALLLVGILTATLGRRLGWPWLVACGVLQQAHVVLYHFFDQRVSLDDLEAAGLPFAVASLLSGAARPDRWFTAELRQVPPELLAAAVGVLLTALAYAVARGLLLGIRLAARPRWPRGARSASPPPLGWAGPPLSSRGLLFGLILVATSPIGTFAESETRMSNETLPAPAAGGVPAARESQPGLGPGTGAVTVGFVGQRFHYALLVDGEPRTVFGMGYNSQHAGLAPDERARRYDRDFALMASSGVNVVFGWFQDQFDEVTLAVARRHGIGVGMPFELNQDLDYDDPAVRARLTAQVLAQVERYRDDPAVWFWTPGNEVIHRLIFPSWLKRQADPLREARADSFARFYVELIDRIHALDPRHPVVYRDAEDAYLARMREALLADGVRRPWFAYGTNVYSRRLAEILRGWPDQGLDVPLLVAEFSPGGTGPADRPSGLRAMWSTIRSYPDWVVGGAVYAWTTDGPEELDRVFGLVDGDGRPRDESLSTIAELYLSDPRAN